MAKIKIFALGGLNEIGKNMYIVDIDNSIFVFDAGLKYADDKMLGVDYIIPKYDYLIQNKKRIKGIFITHGHDEQMGALPDILPELDNIPVYATKFTMEIIKRELEESKINYSKLIEIKPHVKLNFGKVSIFPINLTHSVPDSYFKIVLVMLLIQLMEQYFILVILCLIHQCLDHIKLILVNLHILANKVYYVY